MSDDFIKSSEIKPPYVRRLAPAVGHKSVGPTDQPVKRLAFITSDGWWRPSEIDYVQRRPSDIMLFPTPYL
jgi:hypothetical protein